LADLYEKGHVRTAREGSNIIWRLGKGEGVAQTVRVPSYGRRGWPNRHITFIVTKIA